MTSFSAAVERAWVWAYTAGLPPQEADDRRAEVRSDQWEYEYYRPGSGEPWFGSLRRLFGGVADDVYWRSSLGRGGLSKTRLHETVLLFAVAGFLCVSLPASAWWVVALAGDPAQPGLHVWYLSSAAVSLASSVVGGAASAAYYPRLGRTLMLVGALGLAATLWWAPIVAVLLAASVGATVLAVADRGMTACSA